MEALAPEGVIVERHSEPMIKNWEGVLAAVLKKLDDLPEEFEFVEPVARLKSAYPFFEESDSDADSGLDPGRRRYHRGPVVRQTK